MTWKYWTRLARGRHGRSRKQHLDCVIIDLRTSGIQAIQLAEEIYAAADPMSLPVILYGKRKLTIEEETEVHASSEG